MLCCSALLLKACPISTQCSRTVSLQCLAALGGIFVRYLSILHCIQSICQNNVTADFNPSMDEREGAPEHSGFGDGFWKRCQLRVAPRPSVPSISSHLTRSLLPASCRPMPAQLQSAYLRSTTPVSSPFASWVNLCSRRPHRIAPLAEPPDAETRRRHNQLSKKDPPPCRHSTHTHVAKPCEKTQGPLIASFCGLRVPTQYLPALQIPTCATTRLAPSPSRSKSRP